MSKINKDQEKTVEAPKGKEVDPEQSQSTEKPTEANTDKSTSKMHEENERLKGTVSSLQKKLNDLEKWQQGLKEVVAPQDKEKEVGLEDVMNEFKTLKSELSRKEKEADRNSYIDKLEIPETRKRYLKEKVSADVEDLEQAVQHEMNLLDEVVQVETTSRKAADYRPVSEGVTSLPATTTDASVILNNPEEWKKQHGLS